MTKAWRQEATEAVVQRAVVPQGEGRHLLLCGDPVAAGEVLAARMRAQARDPRHMLDVLTTDGWDAMRWERLDGLDPDGGDWNMRVVEASRLSKRAGGRGRSELVS